MSIPDGNEPEKPYESLLPSGPVEELPSERLYGVQEAADYLGISRAAFRRIAPKPTVELQGVWPRWAKRILDILPLDPPFGHDETFAQGKKCGWYLAEGRNPDELAELRRQLLEVAIEAIGQEQDFSRVLAQLGAPCSFTSWPQAKTYRDGMLFAIKNPRPGHYPPFVE